MAGKRIQSDTDYEKSTKWLIDLANKLEDPLLTSDTDILDGKPVSYWKQAYDLVYDACKRYRRGEMAQSFPGLREVYVDLGWAFDEPADKPQEPPKEEARVNTPPEPLKAPELPKEPPAKSKKKDIWDDD